MKQVIIFLLSFSITSTLWAQTPTPKIVLTKNQQLNCVSTSIVNMSQEAMGQSVETTMNMNYTKKIIVKDIVVDTFKIDALTTKVKMNMSVMGQEKSFDSDKKEDMAGDMKEMGKDINVAKPLLLSTQGKCTSAQPASPEKIKPDANPMSGVMQQMLGGSSLDEITTATYFMLIPPQKKLGDTWVDSLTIGNTKTIWNYKWDSTQASIAVIKVIATETNNSTVNTIGMDMTINMDNHITEIRKVDLTTGIIINNTSTKKINGTIDVMGQSVPLTGTTTTTTFIE